VVVGVFRSVPFPPISISRIVEYIRYVGERGYVSVSELKDKGIEIGKGRGDITRFLTWLGIVGDSNQGIYLTNLGRVLLELVEAIGVSAFHAPLYVMVQPYRSLIDYVASNGQVNVSGIESVLGMLNRVARKTVIRFGIDTGAISMIGDTVRYLGDPVKNGLSRCLGNHPSMNDVARCLPSSIDMSNCITTISRVASSRVLSIDVDCVVNHIYALFNHVQ